jgi:arylsulfatase A-like enzyme/tetratricopeptide (TPR) repeat protein
MKRIGIVALVVILAVVAFVLTRRQPPLNVVLVVFDTCRADHLGCYGHETAETPAVDRLAAEGVLFECAYAQVPLTLPSHTTLFTGTYPESHRIRDNAAYTVPPEQLTLAEVLQERGYKTAAFIGAFPLDARFGLDQGFETYDGYFPLDSERSAEKVNAAAESWISQQSGDGPYFVFLHYFDPHIRYLPPSPFRERFQDAPYDGEIAYTDHCLGLIREKLDRLCPPDRTLWIFTSDHGEGLWEHNEMDHGIFLYDPTIRVPMIWSCPEHLPRDARSSAITELTDVVPTLLELLNIEIPGSVQGSSMAPVLTGEARSAGRGRSHAETYFPRLRHGWSGLRSLRTEDWLFVDAPRQELYSLADDPGQTRNVLADHPERAASLRAQLRSDLERFGASADQPRPMAEIDPETEARLLSLGYLGRVSNTISDPGLEDSLLTGPDPKDRIAAFRHFYRAWEYTEVRDWKSAEEELRKALAIAPGLTDSRRMLAESLAAQGRHREAVQYWEGLAQDYPDDATFPMMLAQALENSGQKARAVEAYRRTVPLVPDPSRVQAAFVVALARMGMLDTCRREKARLIDMRPIAPETLNRAGSGLLVEGARALGLGLFEESIRLFPSHPDAYNSLAWELIESGADLSRGLELAERAVSLDPSEVAFRDTLGWGYLQAGRTTEAVSTLARATEGPFVPEIHHHYGLALLEAGEKEQAAGVLRNILDRAPDYSRADEIRGLVDRSR